MLRPMAFRRTTTARSQAKSQVAKAQSTPLQSLKPTPSAKATRFALTTPAAMRLEDDSEIWAAQPDERIIMTALPSDNAATQRETSRAATTRNTTLGKNTAPNQSPANDILDSVALAEQTNLALQTAFEPADITGNSAVNSDSEPLTGTIVIPEKTAAAAVNSPAEAPAVPPAVSSVAIPGSDPASASVSKNSADKNSTNTKTAVITADSKASQTSRLFAPSISYEGGTIIAEGTAENPVRLEGTGTRIIARKVRLDTVSKIVKAEGSVRVERQVSAKRFSTFDGSGAGGNSEAELITETLQGENFEYNYETRQGKLGATRVRLSNFNISADEIIINGAKYIARNVIIRPGGLTDEEIKIYGTPPFSIRADYFEADTSKPAPSNKTSSDTTEDIAVSEPTTARTQIRGAGLYFKKFRILPIPSALLGRTLGGAREQETYQLTPRFAYNSTDGLLVTVGLKYPLIPSNPERLTLVTDIGVSTKIGFRGGVALKTETKFGGFAIGARLNDVISNQLTNRIELDRLPELTYDAPKITLFDLPGGRRAGIRLGLSAGDYRERFTTENRTTSSSRLQGQVRFTTRMGKSNGPYLDLAARSARYSLDSRSLSTLGFEVGYAGSLGSRLSGQFSYAATKVNGNTPFEFDKVAIQKELRATFDIMLTPRYIIPVDLRYDLDRKQLRERTFGILRNYKTFAYGLTYQSSRQELQFQVRQGF